MADNKDNNNGLLFTLLAATNKKLDVLVRTVIKAANPYTRLEKQIAKFEKDSEKPGLTFSQRAGREETKNKLLAKKEKLDKSTLGKVLKDADSVAGLKNAFGALGAIFAVWITSAKAGIKAFKDSEAATKELTSSFKQLNGTVSNSLSDANRAQNEKKNVQASKDLTKQFMNAERYVSATNNSFRKLGLTLQDVVNTLRKKLLSWLNDSEDFTKMVVKAIVESNTSAFLNTGVADTTTAGLYSAHAVDYALNYARNISSNKGLEFEALLQTEDYQQALQRANSWYTSGMDSNIFQGGLAELLGDAYVPNLTMSKEVMAGYIDKLIAKLADMSLEEQQATLAAWENAGTVLNAVGKNLYSFDEVIGQDAIEVNSSRIEGILQGLEADYSGRDDLLADIAADVRQIAENGVYDNSGLTGDHIGSGTNSEATGGTGSGGDHNKGTLYSLEGVNAVTGWTDEFEGVTGWVEMLADAAGNLVEKFTAADGSINTLTSLGMSIAEYEELLNNRGSNIADSHITLGKAISYDKSKTITGVDPFFDIKAFRPESKGNSEALKAGDWTITPSHSLYGGAGGGTNIRTGMGSNSAHEASNKTITPSHSLYSSGGSVGVKQDSALSAARALSGSSIGGNSSADYNKYASFGANATLDKITKGVVDLFGGSGTYDRATGNSSTVNVTMNMNGLNVAENQQEWENVARTLGSTIDSIKQRDGGL